ncbi:hypothetical protein [Sporolactobacillus sp. THM19-2]|uniref:hypothetical protein n=1 Tax=Sporolactobacillus sp. THM19-2 TaxID=2511171 RepID=UPI00101F065A|nr:hypothetical protein [Sporolactobacillus sp. THM19-2]RYL87037.1 hypothetical protein EWH91_13455 [Sporolactobacillus sp. THM19-2]
MLLFNQNNHSHQGVLTYLEENHEFDSNPKINSDITLLVGYINIGFDSETKKATQIWGFHHNFNWINKKLNQPLFSRGEIKLDIEIAPGDSKKVKEATNWHTFYDSANGWIKFGNDLDTSKTHNIEFFTNTVMSIDNDRRIAALWLKPEFK